MQIHVQRGKEELGTFTLEELEQSLTEGRLKESDLRWHEGMDTWIPLSQLCEQLGTTTEPQNHRGVPSRPGPGTLPVQGVPG